MRLERLLAEIEAQGIELEARGETLHVEAPPGVLTEALVADIRAMKKELLSRLRKGEQRYPFPALFCSNWCPNPVRWYGGSRMKAYCNACWRRLGFMKWYMEPLPVEEAFVTVKAPVRHRTNGPGMPAWYDARSSDYENLIAHLKRMHGADYDAAGEIAERKAAWKAQQKQENG
jgi:hypothetical protein